MAEQLIATRALYIGRARAHNRGDAVPKANVDKYGWGDKVAKAGTKAAGSATADASPTEAPKKS